MGAILGRYLRYFVLSEEDIFRMGLSASVMCRCYVDGRTTPCPYPEHFHPDPTLSPSLLPPLDAYDQADTIFRDWLRHCCEHPNMNAVATFVSSWKGYRMFMDALHDSGDEYYPTLIAELPDHNGVGYTPAEKSELALAELQYFLAQSVVTQRAVLVDTERSRDVSLGSDIRNGALTMDRVTGFDIGFDETGFFVRDRWELDRVLFQAVHVEQYVIHPEEHQVLFIDAESGREFTCHAPFGKIVSGEDGIPRAYLQHFHVEVRPISPRHFRYITKPLMTVFQASVETGNPVRWR